MQPPRPVRLELVSDVHPDSTTTATSPVRRDSRIQLLVKPRKSLEKPEISPDLPRPLRGRVEHLDVEVLLEELLEDQAILAAAVAQITKVLSGRRDASRHVRGEVEALAKVSAALDELLRCSKRSVHSAFVSVIPDQEALLTRYLLGLYSWLHVIAGSFETIVSAPSDHKEEERQQRRVLEARDLLSSRERALVEPSVDEDALDQLLASLFDDGDEVEVSAFVHAFETLLEAVAQLDAQLVPV